MWIRIAAIVLLIGLPSTAGCTRALGSWIPGVCGNGEPEPGYGEECDDGNQQPGDGCDPDCFLEITAGCGNGVLEPVEDCDDGNHVAGDGCDPDCRIEYPLTDN